MATLSNYVVLLWKRRVIGTGAVALRQAFNWARESPELGPLGFLTVLDKNCVLNASGEVRQLVASVLSENAPVIGAAAICYEIPGFWSAIVRSVITGINIASRATFPTMVFADTEPGVNWLVEQFAGNAVQANHLRFALKALRVPYSPASAHDSA